MSGTPIWQAVEEAFEQANPQHTELRDAAMAQTDAPELLQRWSTEFHRDYSSAINEMSENDLVGGLQHPESSIRLQSVCALSGHSTPEAVAAISEFMERDGASNTSVEFAASTLVRIGTEDALMALLQ